MAKNQSDYFQAKHPWSETKDDLLSCYLTPFSLKCIDLHGTAFFISMLLLARVYLPMAVKDLP